jgi:hypothetical protein
MSRLSKQISTNKASFGQFGSMHSAASTEIVAPRGRVIVAITFLADTTVDALVAEDPNNCINTATASQGRYKNNDDADPTANVDGSGGTTIAAGTCVFPKGLTIYGRWLNIDIDADADGGVICYLGE